MPEGDRFQILSIDGGGIRGLFAAAVLAAVEEDLGGNLVDHFDLVAGTSTGGIIALGLGLGFSPASIVDFYVKHGPRIFRGTIGRSLKHWIYRKHPAAPLESALREIFGERLLGESRKRLVIPAYNLGERDVYLFRTPHSDRLRRDYRVPAWKVALATSAAPTYFPAARAVDGLRLVDGGVWANNPSLVALVEAHDLGIALRTTWVLSVGTYAPISRTPDYLDTAGRLGWAPAVARVILGATSLAANNQVSHLLDKQRLLRLDPSVPAAEVALDRTRRSHELINRARHYSRKWMPAIRDNFMAHKASPYSPAFSVGTGS